MIATLATPVLSTICQTHPRLKSKNKLFPDNRETDSIQGYQRVGKQWNARLLGANKITGRRFQWLININFTRPLSIQELCKGKTSLLKNLGRHRNLSLLWRLQINEKNRSLCHFHFVILDGFTNDEVTLKKVFEKAISFLKDDVRIHEELVTSEQNYLSYVNKTRSRHKNKIVLWSKDLPRFNKIGTLHFPWPEEWERLPSVSAGRKGSPGERFLVHRKRKAYREAEAISYRTDELFHQYLIDTTGKAQHEIRKMIFSDLDHWEAQCEKWYKSPEAKPYLEALRKKVDQANQELLASAPEPHTQADSNASGHTQAIRKPATLVKASRVSFLMPTAKQTVTRSRRSWRGSWVATFVITRFRSLCIPKRDLRIPQARSP